MENKENNRTLDELCNLTVEKLCSIYKSESPYLTVATFLEVNEVEDNEIENVAKDVSKS
jgi:hypothetical protein